MIWFLLIATVLASCNHPCFETEHAPSPQLSAIDSLMWQQPDSALTLLLAFAESPESNSFNEFNGHYFQLLVSELLYKNNYEQTNRKDLLEAVAYFDTVGDAFLDARAHYINGVGYYERDSVIEACYEYLKALEVMEDCYDEKELVGHKAQFMALTFTRLCDVFSDQYLHEQAVYFGKRSLCYFSRYNSEPRHVSRMSAEVGINYDILGLLDSASVYYQDAALALSDTNNLIYRDIQAHRIYLSYKTNGNPTYTINSLREQLELSEDSNEYSARCASIGEVFYHEQQFDSAWYYFSQVFRETENIRLKKQMAEWLVEIGEHQELNSNEYLCFLVPFVNEEENKSEIKSLLAELYSSHIKSEYEKSHRSESLNRLKLVFTTIATLVILLIVFFVLYHINKRKKQHLSAQLVEERKAHRTKQKAIGGRLKESGKALRVQREENEKLLKELETQRIQSTWNSYEDFMSEPVCQTILSLLKDKLIKRNAKSDDYPELKLSHVQLSQLQSAVEKHFSGFSNLLTEYYPRISHVEAMQCMLCLLNLKETQIAALMQNDYSTIKKRSSKIRKALGTEKTLQAFTRELVSQPKNNIYCCKTSC